jgi:hypothetical protein
MCSISSNNTVAGRPAYLPEAIRDISQLFTETLFIFEYVIG